MWRDFGNDVLLPMRPRAPEKQSAGTQEVAKTWSPVKEVETLDELLDRTRKVRTNGCRSRSGTCNAVELRPGIPV